MEDKRETGALERRENERERELAKRASPVPQRKREESHGEKCNLVT